MYKYHYSERPKHPKVTVTMETEVPPTISKELRKKNPDKKDFETKMRNYDT